MAGSLFALYKNDPTPLARRAPAAQTLACRADAGK